LAGAVAAGLDRAPLTTSLGRLFDAAAALLGLRTHQDHEAQAAMELEALVRAPAELPGGFCVAGGALAFTGLLTALAEPGRDAVDGANLLHGTVAAGVAAWITEAARAAGMTRVALGGGCLINRFLAEGVAELLRAAGIEPLFARAVPCNDGGLSFGQAALGRAAAQAKGEG
jgi:hydrogenase maturation protein HypF